MRRNCRCSSAQTLLAVTAAMRFAVSRMQLPPAETTLLNAGQQHDSESICNPHKRCVAPAAGGPQPVNVVLADPYGCSLDVHSHHTALPPHQHGCTGGKEATAAPHIQEPAAQQRIRQCYGQKAVPAALYLSAAVHTALCRECMSAVCQEADPSAARQSGRQTQAGRQADSNPVRSAGGAPHLSPGWMSSDSSICACLQPSTSGRQHSVSTIINMSSCMQCNALACSALDDPQS
jgi:hypothetical protein